MMYNRPAVRKGLELCLGLFLVVGFMNQSGIGCPILFLTGVPCLGCGMTRACLRLACLDFKMAFYYHPLCFLMPVLVPAFLWRERIGRSLWAKIQWGIILLFLLVYLIRLLDPDNHVVAAEVEKGLFYRVFQSVAVGEL